MGRNFSPTTSSVVLGDIAAARFEQLSVWSAGAFFRVENTAVDDRSVLTKWDVAADTHQFLLRVDKGVAPQEIEVWTNNTSQIVGSTSLQLDTWYFVVVSNDGTGGATGLKLYVFGMDGTAIDSLSGQHTGDVADLTTDVIIGWRSGPDDEMDGDIAHAFYIDVELTQDQVRGLLRSPGRLAQYSRQFWLPLGMGSPEPDFSGKGNTGAVTTAIVGENPPIGSWFGLDLDWQGALAAAAGGLSIPIAMHHYQHQLD